MIIEYKTYSKRVQKERKVEMIERILLRVPKELKNQLKKQAKKVGLTLNAYIITILIERR